jgi:hypothetical protein
LEIDATLETQVGTHKFCWEFILKDLPAEDSHSLVVSPRKYTIQIKSFGEL